MYEAGEDWAEMRALRHEDCDCEECQIDLEEEEEDSRQHSFKRPYPDDLNPNEDDFGLTKIQRAFRDERE